MTAVALYSSGEKIIGFCESTPPLPTRFDHRGGGSLSNKLYSVIIYVLKGTPFLEANIHIDCLIPVNIKGLIPNLGS